MGLWSWLGNNPDLIASLLKATIGNKANARLEAIFDRLRAVGVELESFATAREKIDELAEAGEEQPPAELVQVEFTVDEIEALDTVLDLIATPTRKIRRVTRSLVSLDPTP